MTRQLSGLDAVFLAVERPRQPMHIGGLGVYEQPERPGSPLTFEQILDHVRGRLHLAAGFWRPLVAWAERFRAEESAAAERPRSVVLDLLRRSAVPGLVARPARPVGRFLDTITRPFGLAEHPLQRPALRTRTGDVFFFGAVSVVVVFGAWKALEYVHVHVGLGAFGPAFVDGAATFVGS
jgi:hypothetical protein